MRLPVEITVTNKKLNYHDMRVVGDIPEPRETSANYYGYMEIDDKGVTVDYDEVFDDGEVESTSVILQDGVALISKQGEYRTNLIFRPGNSCDCFWHNGYRHMNLRVNTQSLNSNLCSLGGKLEIDYTIEIMGDLAEKNSMCVSVCPADSAS